MLIGVIIGGLLTFFVEKRLQDRQFKKEAQDKREILKSLLITLKGDISDYYNILKGLRNMLLLKKFPRDYFNMENKKAMWGELMKSYVVAKNREVFERINNMSSKLEILNAEIKTIQNIISDNRTFTPGSDKQAIWQQEIDYSITLIDETLNAAIIEDRNGLDLVNKLDEIINKLDNELLKN